MNSKKSSKFAAYCVENGLMDKHAEELDAMDLPFKWQYIPLDYPQPDVYF